MGIAVAQPSRLEHPRKMTLESAGKHGADMILMTPKAGTPNSAAYKGYSDNDLDEFKKEMQERMWGSEDTAWERARELDTRQSYERYMAIYPNGAHIAEATCLLIDAKINETLNNAHDALPDIKRVEPDDNTLTSTVAVKNNTIYHLTLYWSVRDIESTVIPPDGTALITVENGDYKIAASVPPSHIKPFAGKTTFVGGRYEMGFWVVPTQFQ